MGTEVRIFIRILIETINNIKRANLMNWVIITTMAAILSIYGCMFRVTLGIDSIVKDFSSNLEISIYLKDLIDPAQFVNKVKTLPGIKNVKLVTKEKAWEDYKKQYSVLEMDNPLPNTLHVTVTKTEEIEPIVENLKKMDEVESVNYPETIAQLMRKMAGATTFVTILLVIVLGGLTLFIISNTIQLLIQSYRREIEIMSMMGVTSWYIKTPYVLQGAFYGLTGSILALLPIHILQSNIVKVYEYFNSVPPQMNMNVVVLAILAMGIIVGSSGSLIAVHRYLRV